jgi:hypothetical protein
MCSHVLVLPDFLTIMSCLGQKKKRARVRTPHTMFDESSFLQYIILTKEYWAENEEELATELNFRTKKY